MPNPGADAGDQDHVACDLQAGSPGADLAVVPVGEPLGKESSDGI
jgi:hypothetical protein